MNWITNCEFNNAINCLMKLSIRHNRIKMYFLSYTTFQPLHVNSVKVRSISTFHFLTKFLSPPILPLGTSSTCHQRKKHPKIQHFSPQEYVYTVNVFTKMVSETHRGTPPPYLREYFLVSGVSSKSFASKMQAAVVARFLPRFLSERNRSYYLMATGRRCLRRWILRIVVAAIKSKENAEKLRVSI